MYLFSFHLVNQISVKLVADFYFIVSCDYWTKITVQKFTRSCVKGKIQNWNHKKLNHLGVDDPRPIQWVKFQHVGLSNLAGGSPITFKGKDFFLLVFYESGSPQPQSFPLELFRIFSKIHGDICKWRCTTGINDTVGKFGTGINDTGGKFCHQFR